MVKAVVCGTLLVAFSASAAGAAVTLRLDEACGGDGFAGTLSDGPDAVDLVACRTASGAYSRVSDPSGRTMVEIAIDEETDRISFEVDGRDYVPGETTEEDWARMRASLIAMPAARLIREHLWAEALAAGREPASHEMAAVGLQVMTFEHFTATSSAANPCLGCCGPKCWGCTGCYTNACLTHDLLCGMSPWRNSTATCQHLFALAAVSMACCSGADLGPLC